MSHLKNAQDIDYTPSVGGNWPDPDPANTKSALDSLADQVNSLNVASWNHAWSFDSPSGTTGVTFYGGFYKLATGGNDFSPSITFGSANNAYAAHFFIVTGAITVDEVTITVSGASFDESTGTRNGADSQTIVIPNSTAANTYFETSKKWLGQITIETTAGTAVACNYGYAKYFDGGNKDFIIDGFEATWVAGATDADPDIGIIHHKTTGWVYSGAGEADYSANILDSMKSDYTPDNDVVNNENGAWKRVGLSDSINGSGEEGIIIYTDINNVKSFERGNMFISMISQP